MFWDALTLTSEGLEWAGGEKHSKAYLDKFFSEFGPAGVDDGSKRMSDMGMVKIPGVKTRTNRGYPDAFVEKPGQGVSWLGSVGQLHGPGSS